MQIRANGFGRAEGCGVLVLKRLSDAIRDCNRIHGLIRGYGKAQEGISTGFGTPRTPTVQCESVAMKNAYLNSSVIALYSTKSIRMNYLFPHIFICITCHYRTGSTTMGPFYATRLT